MFEHSNLPLLQHKQSKKSFLRKYAIFLIFVFVPLLVFSVALSKLHPREASVGDVNTYRHALDSIPSTSEDESDDAEEIEVGDIPKATEDEVSLCEQLRAFTADLSDLTEGAPLFGEELEYHNWNVKLEKGNYLYTNNGKTKKNGGSMASWGYTDILGLVKHQDVGTLITIEGETQTRVEAFTAPLSTEDKNVWLCAYELLAKLRSNQGKGKTLKEAISKLLTGLSQLGKCKAMSAKLSIEYKLEDDGGKSAYDIEGVVSQLNFGVPIALFDPMTVGSTAKASNYNDKQRHKHYKKHIPASLEYLWPLNRLSKQDHAADLAKLQLIPDPIIRSLAAFWREIHLTLLETEGKLLPADDSYWKKKEFKLFPKHKFSGSEAIFDAASRAYDVLFPGEKYGVGHMFKHGQPDEVKAENQWSDYGTTIRKDPWTGIRLNYADELDTKSINVAQYGGQLFIVVETRGEGPIKSLLPSTQDSTVKFEPLMKDFLTAMKEIQSFTSNVQSRCDLEPGKKIEKH